MSFDVKQARSTQAALEHASAEVDCRALHYELAKRAKEWRRAADELEASEEGEAAIELIGSVGPGMRAIGNSQAPWFAIIRVLARDGQASLHLEDDDGRPVYRNYFGTSSPVVVKA